ncbi:MAG: tetratricopeptide repeat protein [Rhizobiaceae bacterium]|nr:tetratricopeptide repeat protein [Rhizobiaceae bacterium]
MRRRLAKPALAAALVALALNYPVQAAADDGRPVRANSLAGAFLAARIAETDSDFANAIEFYTRALAFDPRNDSLKQNLMIALISDGQFDRALTYAQDLKEVPDVERFSRVALAIDAFNREDYRDAGFMLKLSLESDLDRLITSLMSAWADYGAGDGASALERVSTLEGPSWFDVFTAYHEGLIAENIGDDDAAANAYEKLVTNPALATAAPEAFLRAMESYAGLLARVEGADRALELLDQVEKIHLGRLQLAELRSRLENGKPVERVVSTAAEGASEVLLNVGSALNRGGGESFVRLYLRMALALRPDSVPALMQMASLAEQTDRPAEAISFYERVPATSPSKTVAELQLGLNLADLERYDEAITHLEGVLTSDPDDRRAYLALGGVHSARKDYRAAADLYDRAAARIENPDRSDWNIFYQRGIAYERLKEWEKAEPNFFKALELYPDQPQVLNYLGYSWVDMNRNLEEGLELIRKAVEIRPSDGYIVDSLGWAYYRLGRYEEAATELERAVGLMPDDPILNDHLGDAYWRVGRRLEAKFQWAHARDLDPEPDLLQQVLAKLDHGLPPPETLVAALAEPGDTMRDGGGTAAAGDHEDDGVAVRVAQGAGSQPSAASGVHTVETGQSLWTIARDRLGAGARYPEILSVNPVLQGNPDLIYPGQELRLPGPSE